MTTATKVQFSDIMSGVNKWASIDELVSICDEQGYWDEAFMEGAVGKAKRSEIRRLTRQLKDEHGDAWASVEIRNDEGETTRVYKQLALFDVGDFKQAIDYHCDRSSYHHHKAVEYQRRCNDKHGVQLQLPLG